MSYQTLCGLFAEYKQKIKQAHDLDYACILSTPAGQRARSEREAVRRRIDAIEKEILLILGYFDKEYWEPGMDGYTSRIVPPWFRAEPK